MKTKQIKISTTVTDFPLFKSMESIFKEIKKTEADGIELVFGLKSSLLFLEDIISFSKKYCLPILSVHQPIWSGLGIFFDNNFLKFAKKTNVKNLIIHPLPKLSFTDKKARKYFTKLNKLQKEYDLKILLENLPKHYSISVINRFFPSSHDSHDPLMIYRVCRDFDLKMTFDTSHLSINNPQKNPWFKKILPKIENIHLSSFDDKKQHLPLNMGNFDTKDFLNFLLKNNYQGLLTLEVFYPRLITFINTDFKKIKDSVLILKELTRT